MKQITFYETAHLADEVDYAMLVKMYGDGPNRSPERKQAVR
jgi:hypothetical protein